ncbi:MAG: CHAD domain-containing protein [Geodermatophilaceae bacterium]|nr:CHAD domain-containing protein [Geodermatophilaceae bacterium]
MPDVAVPFVADDASTPTFGSALDVLSPRFSVESSPARQVTRIWLDTHDWRLHKAGMVLERTETPANDPRLVLHDAQGRRHTQPARQISWPARIDALPEGLVRSHIESVVGIRALLPAAELRGRQQDLRVLNTDRKTVVRLRIESSVRSGGAELPDQLSVSAVRGYQDQADRVIARLGTVKGVSAIEASLYEQALSVAGRAFGDDVPEPVQLTGSMPASAALIAVLHGFLSTVERTLDGVVRDIDTEYLHDFRVSVRRSRSTLKLAGDVLESGPAEQLGRDLKWLGDLTSPTRDLDVYVLGLPDMAAGLQSAEPADLNPFRRYLLAQRRTEFRRLVRALRSARFRNAIEHWRALGVLAEPSEVGHLVSAGQLAAQRLRQAHRRVTKRGRAIGSDSAPEALHDLRKRCKELRYLLEIFRPLHDPATHRAALKDLKGLQEVLGEFQDAEVQSVAVREFAATMISTRSAPARTVLAMGELAAQLGAHQRHARTEFAANFAAFDSADTRARFRELTSGGPP